MANVVEQLRSIRATVQTPTEQADFDGMIEEYHPPTLAVMTSDYYGGLDIAIPLEMGQEALVARLVVNGYHTAVLSSFGLIDDRAVNLDVRGALVDYNGKVKGIQWLLRGKVITMPFSRVRGRAEVAKSVIEMTCDKYELKLGPGEVATTEVHYVEPLKRIRRIGRIDQLEKLRKAIGAT